MGYNVAMYSMYSTDTIRIHVLNNTGHSAITPSTPPQKKSSPPPSYFLTLSISIVLALTSSPWSPPSPQAAPKPRANRRSVRRRPQKSIINNTEQARTGKNTRRTGNNRSSVMRRSPCQEDIRDTGTLGHWDIGSCANNTTSTL